jgi:hypothetical protein
VVEARGATNSEAIGSIPIPDTMLVTIYVPLADLVDRLSILRIKQEKIVDEAKLRFVKDEIARLETCWPTNVPKQDILFDELDRINKLLWLNSDDRKILVQKGIVSTQLVALFYEESKLNDKRFAVKNAINRKYGSDLQEQKSYEWINTSS